MCSTEPEMVRTLLGSEWVSSEWGEQGQNLLLELDVDLFFGDSGNLDDSRHVVLAVDAASRTTMSACEGGRRDEETHRSMRGRLMSEPPVVPLPLRGLDSSKPQKSSFGHLVRADSRGLNVLKSESDIAEFLVSFGEVSLSREVERLERNQESSPPSPF